MSENLENPILPVAFPKRQSVGATGDWAVNQPVIDFHKCTKCGICVMVCPEGAMTLDKEENVGFPKIDYTVCKGCDICSHSCGPDALSEHK